MVVIREAPKVTEEIVRECQEWANTTGNTYEITNWRGVFVIVRPKNGGKNNGKN